MKYIAFAVFAFSCLMTLINGLKIFKYDGSGFRSDASHILISGFMMIASAIYLWL